MHVQAPAEILEGMVTVRLHLDACRKENGALRVLPGSHTAGRLTPEQIQAFRKQAAEVACETGLGSALLMKPLLLHASSPATQPGHRRVVHLEYACEPLPNGLEWLA